MPITWRNVEAPSNADAMRGFQSAGQSITGAFDRLGDMVKASEVFQQGVRDRADEANVLALKEALQGARTPEDVAKIQGQLSEMRSGLSNKGRTAVLGAEEARVSALQQRLTAENQFKNNQKAQELLPVIERYKAMIAQGDVAGAAAFIKPYEGQIGTGDAVVAGIKMDQSNKVFRDGLDNSKAQRESQTANAAASTKNADSTARSVDIQRQNATFNNIDRITKASADASQKLAAIHESSMDAPNASQTLGLALKGVKPDVHTAIMANISKALQDNPELRKLPIAVVANAALAASNTRFYNLDSNAGSGIGDDLAKLLKDPGVIQQMAASNTAAGNLTDLLAHQRAMLRSLNQSGPVPSGAANQPVPLEQPAPTQATIPEVPTVSQGNVNRLDRASSAAPITKKTAMDLQAKAETLEMAAGLRESLSDVVKEHRTSERRDAEALFNRGEFRRAQDKVARFAPMGMQYKDGTGLEGSVEAAKAARAEYENALKDLTKKQK